MNEIATVHFHVPFGQESLFASITSELLLQLSSNEAGLQLADGYTRTRFFFTISGQEANG